MHVEKAEESEGSNAHLLLLLASLKLALRIELLLEDNI
jgi:hypothetical protein